MLACRPGRPPSTGSMTVASLLSPLDPLATTDTVGEALVELATAHLAHLPVLDPTDRLDSVVTEAALRAYPDPEAPIGALVAGEPVVLAEPVADVEPVPGVPKPDPILVVDRVTRTFGGLRAVDVDHLEVQRGAITSLIGPNGAGKTTFFNLLTGFDTPDEALDAEDTSDDSDPDTGGCGGFPWTMLTPTD